MIDYDADISDQTPKDVVAAVIFLGEFFDTIWTPHPHGGPGDHLLENIEQREIENISHGLKIIVAAHQRMNSQVEIPDEVLVPFSNSRMGLPKSTHTFLTKLMPIEARKYAANVANRDGHDFFDDVEPNSMFKLEVDEKKRVFDLIAEIRELIGSDAFPNPSHKRRLLRGLNKIEIEVHKGEGLWDVVLARGYEVLDFAESAGNKSKPIVDRYKEIKSITGNKTNNYEAIEGPEEQKRLPAPEEEE